MADLECGESGSTAGEMVEAINKNTNDKYGKIGGLISGNVQIGDGSSGSGSSLTIVAVEGGEIANLNLYRSDGTRSIRLTSDALDRFRIMKYAEDGNTLLSSFEIDDTGNASVLALLPTLSSHLARMDYVDNKITPSTVCRVISGGTMGFQRGLGVSVSVIGVGIRQITFDTPKAASDYAITNSMQRSNASGGISNQTNTGFEVHTYSGTTYADIAFSLAIYEANNTVVIT